jgi:hypothetical protein
MAYKNDSKALKRSRGGRRVRPSMAKCAQVGAHQERQAAEVLARGLAFHAAHGIQRGATGKARRLAARSSAGGQRRRFASALASRAPRCKTWRVFLILPATKLRAISRVKAASARAQTAPGAAAHCRSQRLRAAP